MCSDGVKDTAQRYQYPNALAGMIRIGREEGLGAFTKGLGANIVRSILMSKLMSQSDDFKANRRRCFADRSVSSKDWGRNEARC